MHRIDSPTAEADTHGSGKDGFTEGTPPGTPPTQLTDDWFNDVQEELCNVIEDNGVTLVKGTNTQLLAVFRQPVGVGTNPAIDATGGSTSGEGLKGTGGAPNGHGVRGVGTGTGRGVVGTGGGSDGIGVFGTGGATNGRGVFGQGVGSGAGVWGTGGTSNGVGVNGFGGSTNGVGVNGDGRGSGAGVTGTGGSTAGAAGVSGTGGSGGGVGVSGSGVGANAGVSGTGGATAGSGVSGTGGTGGIGVSGTGNAAGTGVVGVGGVSGKGGAFTAGGGNTNGLEGTATGTGSGVRGIGVDGHGVLAESDTSSPARSALRVAVQDADPTTNTAGSIYTRQQNGKLGYGDGSEWEWLSRKRLVTIAQSSSETGTSENTFDSGSYPIDANTLRVGSVIRSTYILTFDDQAGPANASIRWKLGGTEHAIVGITSADGSFKLVCESVVRSIGASGSFLGSAYILGQSNANINIDTFDTTGDLAITLTVQFSGTGVLAYVDSAIHEIF